MASREKAKAFINDEDQMRAARAAVNEEKVALGEREPVWWGDGSPDYNRHMATNTTWLPFRFRTIELGSGLRVKRGQKSRI